ncbi:MAG: GTP-binding protein [Tatlockia sp.]|nr:GTP-binding protein [Tatlockia sp.]
MTNKIYIFGEQESGKTQLQKKLITPNARFDSIYKPTIGVDLSITSIGSMKVHLWDSSGSYLLRTQTQMLTKDTDVAVYCIDLSKPLNKEKIDEDIASFREVTGKSALEIPIILVGTKTDLESKITDEEFEQLFHIKKYGFKDHIKVSSKNNENITKVVDIFYPLLLEKEPPFSIGNTSHSFFENHEQSESRAKKERDWEISNCQIALLACIPVIGWAILLIYAGYHTCCSTADVDENSESELLTQNFRC